MATRAILTRIAGNSIRTQITRPAFTGSINSYTTEKLPPVSEKIRTRQEIYQAGDSPVFIKGGVFDGLLYRFTLACCVTSLGCIVMLVYQLARPKHK